MDRKNGNPDITTRPDLTDEEVERCVSIVHEILGPEFGVIAHLPRNVGIKGDSGIWGETLLITAHDQDALSTLSHDPDKLRDVSIKLTNTFDSLTRVLIDTVAQSPDITLVTPQIKFVPDPPIRDPEEFLPPQ